jgi:hypothetical protein
MSTSETGGSRKVSFGKRAYGKERVAQGLSRMFSFQIMLD